MFVTVDVATAEVKLYMGEHGESNTSAFDTTVVMFHCARQSTLSSMWQKHFHEHVRYIKGSCG